MTTQFRPSFVLIMIVFAVSGQEVCAQRHIQEVIDHTEDAVLAAGDSRAIQRHAQDALNLIDEAKEANASRKDVLKLIHQGEVELDSVITNAARYNSSTALEDAIDAREYLEAANQAADTPKP